MTASSLGPLAADWLRISRRWDIWLLTGAIVAAAAAIYLGAFRASVAVMGVGNPGSWGPGDGPPPEQWFLDAMLSLRAPYAFPASLLTVLDAGWLVSVLAGFAAVVTIGADFGWGTLRSILATRRSRTSYLSSRLFVIAVLILGSFGAMLILALVSQPLLALLAGERFPTAPLDLGTFFGVWGARLLAALGYTAVGAALVLFVRSLAGAIVLLVAFVGIEVGVGAAAGALGVPILRELTLLGSTTSIVEQLRPAPVSLIVDYDVGALVPSAHQLPAIAHALSPEIAALVAGAWVLGALVTAFVRIKTMDVLE